MKQFHFYDETTGLLHGNSIAVNVPDGHVKIVLRHCPSGHKPIEGTLHPRRHRVDIATGEVIDYTPPAPSAEMTAAEARASALQQIAALESRGTRAMREALLDQPGAKERVAGIDSQIAALRASL